MSILRPLFAVITVQKKLLKLLAWVTLETVIVTAGIYAGSQALKRLWKLYGPLGGGAGKDPNAE